MNQRVTYLLFLVFCIIFAALVFQSGQLVLLAMPFLAYLAVGVVSAPDAVHLRATRFINPLTVTANSLVEVRVEVENEGVTTLFLALVDPAFPALPICAGSRKQCLALPAGEKTDLCFSFFARRGSYTWETLRITNTDPLGLFEKTWELPARADLLVFPERTRLRHLALRPRRLMQTSGPFLARQAGPSTDIWGIREYQTGDPLRWVHWLRSARHPSKFFTKAFEREAMADIGLILDGHGDCTAVGADDGPFAYSIQAAASLAEGFLREGNRVGLLIMGEQISALFPGTGKGQWLQIQRRLAQARTAPESSLDRLKYLPVRMFPSRALLVVVSPLLSRDVPALTRLRGLGYAVLVISPNLLKERANRLPSGRSRSLAMRLARCERALQFWQLRQQGVEVIDWPVEQDLSRVIQVGLRKHNAGRDR